MTDLLSAEDLAAIKSALKDTVDTFFKQTIYIRHRFSPTTVAQFGEKARHKSHDYAVIGLSEFTRRDGQKDTNVYPKPTGQSLEDGWRFYFWKEDIDALLTVDPESDKVILNGMEYIIHLWTPSAWFGGLGELFYEMEIKRDSAVIAEPPPKPINLGGSALGVSGGSGVL